MQFNLTWWSHLLPLLKHYESVGQQPDNLCGPYWISLLLEVYGDLSLSAVEVALAANTVLPSHGDPADWVPPGATSRHGPDYDRIPTSPDLAACGTSATGLIRATEHLSQGRFCLLPLQTEDWITGIPHLLALCSSHPDLRIVPILNVHTRYFWGTQLTPWQLFTYLETGQLTPPPTDWSVGHFALLTGQVQGKAASLYVVLDTYPQFGGNGMHPQPADALARSLQRPDYPTQGGILLFVKVDVRSQVRALVEAKGFQIAAWDNGSPE
ncbi:MAG: hypothetical protein AAFN08_01975 [Cyanobacteria bacterium J06559_3]